MASQCVYSAKGCSFYITDTAPDASLLITDSPLYAWAQHLERSIPLFWSNSKINQKMFHRYKVFHFAKSCIT